jgi:AraC-like DNA-binding protein
MFLLPVDGQGRPLGVFALRSLPATGGREESPGGPPAASADHHFRRAMSLLRLLANEAAARHRAASLASDLEHLRDALKAHERELHQLRGLVARLAPGLKGAEISAVARTAVHPTVQRVLDSIHGRNGGLSTLKGIANELGMNASYVSFLFSRELGLPFRSYLAALRLQRAQDLLRSRRTSIAEAAKAVGYGSTDRFRAAFRQWSGLAPGKWRRVFGKA